MRQSICRGVAALSMCALLAGIAACGGSSAPTATTNGNNGGNNGGNYGGNNGGNTGGGSTSSSISVIDNAFNPSATTVAVGTTVTWTWSGSASHDVTWDDGSNLHSATQSSGTYSRTFSAAGTYKYHCSVHGAAMSGSVTVQ